MLTFTCTKLVIIRAAVREATTRAVTVAGPVTVQGVVAVHFLGYTSRKVIVNIISYCESVLFELDT